MKPRVVVAHPGTQHAPRLVLALQEGALLQAFVTRLYWSDSRFPYNLLSRLPLLGRIAKEKGLRRSLSGIDPAFVRDIDPYTDLSLYGLKAIGWNSAREWLMFHSSQRFGRVAAAIAAKEADGLVAFDTASRDAFRGLVGSGVTRLLDFSHPHVQGHEILKEESRLDPEWAATLDFHPGPYRIAAFRQEELLADHVLCASEFSRKCLVADGVPSERISVVPYGVDLVRFRPAAGPASSRPLQVLFVGQAGQRKGIAYLLRAMRSLSEQEAHLHVVGALIGPTGPYRKAPSNVTFHGRVTEQELVAWYQRVDVFVLPSLVEGFGLVILEAMASGVPVIVTPHGAGPELVEEGVDGFVVPIRSPERIASALRLLASDRILLQDMKRAARRKAELFPWQRYSARVCGAVSAAITGARRAKDGHAESSTDGIL